MEQILVVIAMAIFGLLFGSFCGASVWRLRAKQLVEDNEAGEKVDRKELQRLEPLLHQKVKDDRSRCLHCSHELAWYDLLPLVSWLQLRGRCRYCRKRIGKFEPVIELATACVFVISYIAWPFEMDSYIAITQFIVWLIALVGLIILFCYDMRWYLLPDSVMFPVIGLAAVYAAIQVIVSENPIEALVSLGIGVSLLSGLYYAFYIVSKGAWVGFGDIKLGLALALLVGQWPLALLILFLSNVIGCIVVLPAMAAKKIGRHSRVPFGPMLIAAWWLASLFGSGLISWYLAVSYMV